MKFTYNLYNTILLLKTLGYETEKKHSEYCQNWATLQAKVN